MLPADTRASPAQNWHSSRVRRCPRSLPGLLPDELEELAMARSGQPAYRGDRSFRMVHRRGVLDPAHMTNVPVEVRGRLDDARSG